MLLGVLDKNLSQEKGWSIIGLIKNTNYKKIARPKLLKQCVIGGRQMSSFQIDSPNKALTLASGISSQSPIDIASSDNENIILLLDLHPLGNSHNIIHVK